MKLNKKNVCTVHTSHAPVGLSISIGISIGGYIEPQPKSEKVT